MPYAVVSDHAVIYGNAVVKDCAKVYGYAKIGDKATMLRFSGMRGL